MSPAASEGRRAEYWPIPGEVAAILEALALAGIAFYPDGSGGWRMRSPHPEALVPVDLARRARAVRAGLFRELDRWPAESFEVAARFRQPHLRLSPLLGSGVLTPAGPARLLAVAESGCAVAVEGEGRSRVIPYGEVVPG